MIGRELLIFTVERRIDWMELDRQQREEYFDNDDDGLKSVCPSVCSSLEQMVVDDHSQVKISTNNPKAF